MKLCLLVKLEGILRWPSGKELACQCRRFGFSPWVRKILWRRKWQPSPVFSPGKSHGQRSLAGYCPCGHRELDMTECTSNSNIDDLQCCITFRCTVKWFSYICMYTYMYVCKHICIYIYACVHTCALTHTHTRTLFQILSILDYYTLSIVPRAIW